MIDNKMDPLVFFKQLSFMTDPGVHADLFSILPKEIPALRKIVQGLLVHQYWAGAYGFTIPEDRLSEYQIRDVASKLERILELDGSLLTRSRPVERRLIGNCRDYAVLLTSMLRYQGVPARTRCGFGAYFSPGWYEDHLICEYWNFDEQSWVFVDAELDDVHQKALGYSFDPCAVPRDQFIPGGKAWLMCRHGEADPHNFGYGDTVGGLPNIRGNLVRDIAFLNKVEILGWDYWGIIEADDSSLNEDDLALLDRASTLSIDSGESFHELRSFYLSDMRLRVPPIVRRFDDVTFTYEDILKGDQSLVKYL